MILSKILIQMWLLYRFLVRVICVLPIYYSNYNKAVYANVKLLLLQNVSNHVSCNVKLSFKIKIPHIYNLQTSRIHTSTSVCLPASTAAYIMLFHKWKGKNWGKYNSVIIINISQPFAMAYILSIDNT